jgi:hypothetical protein
MNNIVKRNKQITKRNNQRSQEQQINNKTTTQTTTKYIFIGDSNIKPFLTISKHGMYYIFKKKRVILNEHLKDLCYTECISGASMYGIPKKGRLEVKEKIMNTLNTYRDARFYVFLFGYVDINFVCVNKKMENPNFNEISFYHSVIHNYIQFVKSLNKRVILLEVPYNTFKRAEDFEKDYMIYVPPDKIEETKKFFEKNPYNQKENKRITDIFNSVVKKKCIENGIPYVEYNKDILKNNGNIREEYIISNANHHYSKEVILKLFVEKLRGMNGNFADNSKNFVSFEK